MNEYVSSRDNRGTSNER